MTNRLAQFSVTYDGNESGTVDAVINAGTDKGFTVAAIDMNWQPHSMSGASDEVPYLAVARFASAASGGTAGTVFSYDDGDTASASALIAPTALGSGRVDGPQFWPGAGSYTGSVWYLHGGRFRATEPAGLQVGKGHSLWIRATNLASVTVYFHENLAP